MKNLALRFGFVVCFLLLAASLFVAIPARAAEPAPILEILNESITVDTSTEKGAENAVVITIRNNGPEIPNAQFRAAIDTTKGTTSIAPKPATVNLKAYTVSQVKLAFDPVEEVQSGYLVLEAEGIAPAFCPLTINPPQPVGTYGLLGKTKLDTGIVLRWSFWIGFLAFVVVGVVWCVIAFQYRKKDPLKPGDVFHARMETSLHWDFTKNWASSFSLLSGFFIALAGLKVIPESPTLFGSGSLTVFIVFFPALILLAPMMVSSLNSLGKEPRKTNEDAPILFDGSPPILILPFIIGSGLVVWSVTGEMIALIALFSELQVSEIISANTNFAAQILVVIFWGVGFYYSMERVVQSALTAKMPDEIIKAEELKDKQIAAQVRKLDNWGGANITDEMIEELITLTPKAIPSRKLYLP